MDEVQGQRIAQRMRQQGLTQAIVAKSVGLSQPAIGRLINGETKETSKIVALARALKTTPEYLLGQVDDPDEGSTSIPSIQTLAAGFGLVAVRELDLTFGMGATYMDVPVTEHSRHFSRDWLRQYTKADPDNLLFAQGAGDSMFPTLLDSDLMLIDCSQRSLNMTDKIWAIAWNECGAIKRLRPTRDGGVSIMSDNPTVSDAVAYDDEMHILGRVVAVVRKI